MQPGAAEKHWIFALFPPGTLQISREMQCDRLAWKFQYRICNRLWDFSCPPWRRFVRYFCTMSYVRFWDCRMRPSAAIARDILTAVLLVGNGWLFALNACGQDPGNIINNVFPLAPRELRQHLTRAKAALEEERFSDAVAEIGEVLNSAGNDDFFLGAPGSPDAQL